MTPPSDGDGEVPCASCGDDPGVGVSSWGPCECSLRVQGLRVWGFLLCPLTSITVGVNTELRGRGCSPALAISPHQCRKEICSHAAHEPEKIRLESTALPFRSSETE